MDPLAELAHDLNLSGWAVEVGGLDEPTWSRLRESAEHALVDVLNVVLDESERHLIDAVIAAVVSWAAHRRYFAGRGRAKPDVAIWLDGDIVRTVTLPGSRFDILLQVEVASVGAARDLEHALNAVLPDGDGLKLTAAGGVSGVHLETGLAEIRGDGEEEAVATVCAAFGTQNMGLVRRGRSPGGDATLLVFASAGVDLG